MAERDIEIKENLGLVHACAKRFKGRGIDYDDLYQAGCVGLVKAFDNFDSTLGYKFSTYAVPVIIGEIKRLFRDGGAVKVSRGLKELSLKVTREVHQLELENGREPTIKELSEIMSVEPEQISEALNVSMQPVSLTITDDEGDSQIDIPVQSPDESITEIMSLNTEISRLDERDRKIIYLRYFKNMTQSETAKKLDMTQVQISRREKKILLHLREKLA